MSLYTYTPFRSERAIRLIEIIPGQATQFNIITVELETAPLFMALSYAWGDAPPSIRLQIGRSRYILVTESLRQALASIREFALQRHLMIWADQICINQEDIEEKSTHVRFMNTIYRSAELVTVWLGPAANDSDLAFGLLRDWNEKFHEELKKFKGYLPLAYANIQPDKGQQRALQALLKITQRPWWTRAWIVQEATIGKSGRTILFCGTRCIDWTYMRTALTVLRRNSDRLNLENIAYKGTKMAIGLNNFRQYREAGANFRLLKVLGHMRDYQCTKPHDKVYAALGMAMDVDKTSIIPDYRRHYSVVYLEVVNFLLHQRNGHHLDFLGEAWKSIQTPQPGRRQRFILPSWVPDWTSPGLLCPFQKYMDWRRHGISPKAYNASGTLNGRCHMDDKRLRLKGSIVDHITRVSSIITPDSNLPGTIKSWGPGISKRRYFTGETFLEAFSHVLVGDLGHKPLRGNYEQAIKQGRIHKGNIKRESKRGYAVDWDLYFDKSNNMSATKRDEKRKLHSAIRKITDGRRIFETTRGLVGIGPPASCVGNEVSVLLGGQVLYVLGPSRTDGCHEYIGECYVHGMMDGQACEDPLFSVRDIVLV